MIYAAKGGTQVVVPWQPEIASLIPHAREIAHAGERMLVIPYGRDEAKLCRNLGLPVPSPIMARYDWPGNRPPWDAQKLTAAMLTESQRAYVLSTMGTGKTRATIWALDFLRREGKVKRVLIAAPLSTLSLVWEQELFAVLPHARVRVLHGERKKRRALLAEDADFYIINHHGLAVLRDELAKRGFGVFVIDELAVLRNKSSQLWKAAATVVDRIPYVWGLTGSPTPTSPVDAYAQVRLLTPNMVPKSIGGFRDLVERKVSQFKWLVRPEANQIVHRAMQPSVRFTREDIMELPPTTYIDRKVMLGAEAKAAYKMLFDKMRVKTGDGRSITAVNEGVLQMKLVQVACGYIYTDNRTVYELPNHDRLKALDDTIMECDRKLLVFVPFVHALNGVATYLRKQGHSVEVVYGATSRAARDKIFNNFRNDADPRIIVAHPQTMAHGLTLTEANTIVWYAPIDKLEIYEQANARVTRPGQTSKTLIVHLSGTPVERAAYRRLKSRASMQGVLLELFAQQELDF